MKTKNSLRWLALFASLGSLPVAAHAQETVDGAGGDNFAQDQGQNLAQDQAQDGVAGVAGVASVVYVAQENALSQLPGILGRASGPGAVSLRSSEAAFNGNPAARDALLRWVRAGGVVFLHTGAARAFGFRTVEARPGTNQLAGQVFGRARAALPFGAHPLLMDSGNQIPGAARMRSNTDPTELPGVNVVFYEMQPGDHLVESHPAGTPLLQVSDLAANANAPLYACAIAPFGRGWAIFTPDSLDLKHGDGGLFARNLLAWATPARNARGARALPQWVSVPATLVENGAPIALRQAIVKALQAPSSPALPAFGTTAATPAVATAATEPDNPQNKALGVAPLRPAPRAPVAPPVRPAAANGAGPNTDANGAANGDANGDTNVAAAPADDAGLVLTRAEATAYAALLSRPGQSADVATNVLQARLALSRGDGAAASRALDVADGLVPNSAEVALARGLVLAGASQELNQPSPVRATLLNDAARQFQQAAQAPSLLRGAAANAGNGNGNGNGNGAAGDEAAVGGANMGMGAAGMMGTLDGPSVGGIPLATIGELGVHLAQIAQVFALEPPLVQQFGVGDASITVRAVENDNTLRLVVPGAQALANARNFGWRGDREEILLFPTPESYAIYRQALGLNGATIPLPAGAVGDVVGQRILMVALPSLPVIQRNPVTGTNRVLTTGNTSGSVLARLHSYVLLNALDEGGAGVPGWLQLGVENLVDSVVTGNPQLGLGGQGLSQVAQAGGLLTPDQFGGGGDQNGLAQAQAASLVAFFYAQYGAGAVVETLQRVGTGQSIDEALQATTEGDQAALFENWRAAQFGPGQLPNGGTNGGPNGGMNG